MSVSLNLSIASFSYKKGVPVDSSIHGGGYVFDCRCLPNPGRQEAYKKLTGKDVEVVDYLEKEAEVLAFRGSVKDLVDQSVQKYLSRNFDYLSVSFGCTGGQHRSVYMAEFIYNFYSNLDRVNASIVHREYGTYGF